MEPSPEQTFIEKYGDAIEGLADAICGILDTADKHSWNALVTLIDRMLKNGAYALAAVCDESGEHVTH